MRASLAHALSAGLAAALLAGAAQAEFNLNWEADGTPPANSGGCWQFSPDCSIVEVNDGIVAGQTPFIYQVVQQDGQSYYHMVVGDPESGFAQEVYIQAGGASVFDNRADTAGNGRPSLSEQSSSSGGGAPFSIR